MTDQAARARPAKKSEKKKAKAASAESRGGKKPAAKKAGKKPAAKKPAAKKAVKVSKARAPRVAKKKASKARTTRKTATQAKRKTGTKKAKHRPPLNLRAFRSQLERLHGELMQTYINVKGDSRSRESDGTEDYIDYAVSSYDREFLLSLTELERGRLSQVDDALKRIGQGQYGSCTQCAKLIPTKRLEVQPWARYCVRCQELADSGLADDDPGFPSAEDEGDPLDDDEIEADDEDGVEEESQLIGG